MYKISIALDNTDEKEVELIQFKIRLQRMVNALYLTDVRLEVMRSTQQLVLIATNLYKDNLPVVVAIIESEVDYAELKIGRPH